MTPTRCHAARARSLHGRGDTVSDVMNELAAVAAVFAMDVDADAIEEMELEESVPARAPDFDQRGISETSSEEKENDSADAASHGVEDANQQVSNAP